MACIPKNAFPYNTACDTLKKEGDACDNSYECGMNALCWY